MSSIEKLLDELDGFSDKIHKIGIKKDCPTESPLFFGLSDELDDILERYSQELASGEPSLLIDNDAGC